MTRGGTPAKRFARELLVPKLAASAVLVWEFPVPLPLSILKIYNYHFQRNQNVINLTIYILHALPRV